MNPPEPTNVELCEAKRQEKNTRNPWCKFEYERSVVTLNERTWFNTKNNLTTINPDGNLTLSGESGPNTPKLEEHLSYVGNAEDEKNMYACCDTL